MQSNILQSFDTTSNIIFIKREEKRVPLKKRVPHPELNVSTSPNTAVHVRDYKEGERQGGLIWCLSRS